MLFVVSFSLLVLIIVAILSGTASVMLLVYRMLDRPHLHQDGLADTWLALFIALISFAVIAIAALSFLL